MALKLDVRVPVEGAVELGAWPLLPEEDGLHPAITFAHGLRAQARGTIGRSTSRTEGPLTAGK
jgi:hypothetical protein